MDTQSAGGMLIVDPPQGRGDHPVVHDNMLRPHAEDLEPLGVLWVSLSIVMTPRPERLGNGSTGPGLVEQ